MLHLGLLCTRPPRALGRRPVCNALIRRYVILPSTVPLSHQYKALDRSAVFAQFTHVPIKAANTLHKDTRATCVTNGRIYPCVRPKNEDGLIVTNNWTNKLKLICLPINKHPICGRSEGKSRWNCCKFVADFMESQLEHQLHPAAASAAVYRDEQWMQMYAVLAAINDPLYYPTSRSSFYTGFIMLPTGHPAASSSCHVPTGLL